MDCIKIRNTVKKNTLIGSINTAYQFVPVHAMATYDKSGGMYSHILDLITRRR
jgi:hypothetical protein